MSKTSKSKSLAVGEGVREFYSCIKDIAEAYNEHGYKKQTVLYRHLKDNLSWKMSFETFKYHFKKHIIDGYFFVNPKIDKKVAIDPKKEFEATSNRVEKETVAEVANEDKEPTIVRTRFGDEKRFNPHTVDIDPDRMI